MLIVRTGGDRSGRKSFARLNWKFPLDRELHAAAGTAPVAGDRGEAGDGAHGHAAARRDAAVRS